MNDNAYKMGNTLEDCFSISEVDYNYFKNEWENRKYKNGRRGEISRNILNKFISSGIKCAVVKTELFYNNNDCRTALSSFAKRNKFPVKVKMLYGEVYIIREEGKKDG